MKEVKKKLVSLLRNLFKEEEPVCQEARPVKISVVLVKDRDSLKINDKEQPVSKKTDDEELDRLEELLNKVLFEKKEKKTEAPTLYILDSSDDQWFYAPNSKSMVRIPGGSQLIVSDDTPNDDGKILCYCDFGFVLVPMEELIPLGYN